MEPLERPAPGVCSATLKSDLSTRPKDVAETGLEPSCERLAGACLVGLGRRRVGDQRKCGGSNWGRDGTESRSHTVGAGHRVRKPRLGVPLTDSRRDVALGALFVIATPLEADVQQECLDDLFVRFFGALSAGFDPRARG